MTENIQNERDTEMGPEVPRGIFNVDALFSRRQDVPSCLSSTTALLTRRLGCPSTMTSSE